MRTILITSVLLLAGCAASPPATGNAKGGVIEWFGTTAKAVQAEADRHCGLYGKQARITEMRAVAGGHVLFECL
jgi:hypothetical protein